MADAPKYLSEDELGLGKGSAPQPQYLKEGDLGIKPPKRGVLGAAKDVGIWALQGAIGVPEAAVGWADIPTGGRVGRALENKGGAVGFRPQQAREYLSSLQTEATQEAQRKFAEAEGFGGKLKAAVQNPSNIASTVVQSLPLMGAGGVAARGLMGATNLGQMGARGAAIAAAAGEGIAAAGANAEQARQESDDGLLTGRQAAFNAATGFAVGSIAGVSNRLANKLGIGDIDVMLAEGVKGMRRHTAESMAQAALDPKAAERMARSIPRKIIEGAFTEGVLEELPQEVSEQVLQNLGDNRPWYEDVDASAVLGLLSGAAMGGGAAGFRAITERGAQPEPAAETPPPAGPTPMLPPPVIDVDSAGAARTAADRNARLQESRMGGVFDRTPVPPSVQMGLDPAKGSLSAAAALAVDSGASPAAEVLDFTGIEHNIARASTAELLTEFASAPEGSDLRRAIAQELSARAQQYRGQQQPEQIEADQPSLTNDQRREADGPQALETQQASTQRAQEAGQAPQLGFDDHDAAADRQGDAADGADAPQGGGQARVGRDAPAGLLEGPATTTEPDALAKSDALEKRAAELAPRIDALTADQARTALAAIGEDKGFQAQRDPHEKLRNTHPDDVEEALAAIAEPSTRVDDAAAAANTAPSDAQIEAGNYQKGHLSGPDVQGLNITIENPKGSERSGTDGSGRQWSVTMPAHYGYVKGSTASDGEQVDITVGPDAATAGAVYVVDQINQKDGSYDEAKALFGFSSEQAALDTYRASFEDGWKVGPVTAMSVDEFKQGIKDGRFKKPVSDQFDKAGKAKAATGKDYSNKWFGSKIKAEAFIKKEGIGSTHEAHLDGKRFYIQEKFESKAVNDFLSGQRPDAPQVSEVEAELDQHNAQQAARRGDEDSVPAARAMDADDQGRPADGQSIRPGDVFQTASGQTTTPFPRAKSGLATDRWLAENALAEARSRGDEFNAPVFERQLAGLQPSRKAERTALSPADRSALNLYLWTEQPPVVRSALKPLVPGAESQGSTLAQRWDRMDAAGRAEIVKRVPGWVKKDGEPNVVGRGIMAKRWMFMSPKQQGQIETAASPGQEHAGTGDSGAANEQRARQELAAAMADARSKMPRGYDLRTENGAITLMRNDRVAETGFERSPAGAAQALRVAQVRARNQTRRVLDNMRERARRQAAEAEAKQAAAQVQRELYNELIGPESELIGKSRKEIEAAIREKLEARSIPGALNALNVGALASAIHAQLATDSKKTVRDEAAKGSAIEDAMGRVYGAETLTDEARIAFTAGFEHALAGKTKSTMSGENYGDMLSGYDEGRRWAESAEGQAWSTGGKRKLQNTGVDLRRFWEQQRADMGAEASDIEAAWNAIHKSTGRAALFAPYMPSDAPAAWTTYMTQLRDVTMTFQQYLDSKHRWYGAFYGRGSKDKAARERAMMLEGRRYPLAVAEDTAVKQKWETDEAFRIQWLRDQAMEYMNGVQELLAFAGDTTSVEEASKRFVKQVFAAESQDAAMDPERMRTAYLPGLFLKPYADSVIRNTKWSSRGRDAKRVFLRMAYGSSFTQGLIENPQAIKKPSRRTPLTNPKLDRVTRDGGEDVRKGKDVTPQQFKERFGFADVGFGNWVGAQQDQDHLNYAHDAFVDLARHFGLPLDAIGFGGNLHFTIGALGHGRAAAHYSDEQPGPDGPVKVINVTNTKGDGTVYHEWGHAFDFNAKGDWKRVRSVILDTLKYRVYSRQEWEALADRFLSGNSYWRGDKGMDRIDSALRAMDYYKSGARRSQTAFKKNADKLGKDYWGNDFELFARTVEAWSGDTLGHTNSYLVNTEWSGENKVTPAAGYRGTPYATGKERVLFNQLMDALTKATKYENGSMVVNYDEFMRNAPAILKESEDARQELASAEGMEAYAKRREERLQMAQDERARLEQEEERKRQEKLDQQAKDVLAQLEQMDAADETTADPPKADAAQGPLSEDELNAIFDQAEAELDEETADAPGAPAPGDSLRKEPKTPRRQPTSDRNQQPAPQEPLDKDAAELIAKAAKLGVKGADEALKGLSKLFGAGPATFQSFPGGFNEDTYKAAKPHFKAALEAFQEAGKTLKDLFKVLIEQFGAGVRPYAIRFAQDENLSAQLGRAPNQGEAASPSTKVARFVRDRLASGTPITWRELFAQADEAFGGTQAEGKYTPKDAYDAMEAGMNRYIIDNPRAFDVNATPEAAVAITERLHQLLQLLPTQSKRTAEQNEFQQFSTVPPLAYVANWVANIESGDTYLEPSAGVGGLSAFAERTGARMILNELSARRAGVLREVMPTATVYQENAEQINNVLAEEPTVVVMNPPFSATAGRIEGRRDTKVGARHVEQAMLRLADGGRLVAVMGEGIAMDKPAFRSWWKEMQQKHDVRAVIPMDGSGYAKYGTTFDNVLIVIDKVKPSGRPVVTTPIKSYPELIGLLREIRNARPAPSATSEVSGEIERAAASSAAKGVADESEADTQAGQSDADAGAGVGGRQSGRKSGAGRSGAKSGSAGGRRGPRGAGQQSGRESGRGDDAGGRGMAAAPADSGLDGPTITVEAGQAPAAPNELTESIFENYVPQRVRIPGAQPHPGALVQSAAMAAVQPLTPTYTPNLPQKLIDDGLLSIAQLESIVYAGQAHQEMLPAAAGAENGAQVRRGFFIGDGTGVGKGREISGIILDNWRQGRRKAVWVSEKQGLRADAKRDYSEIGGDPEIIIDMGKAGEAITAEEGVMFTTYATLRSASKQRGDEAPVTRLDQLVEWLGEDFDGVIVFDESHNAGNAIAQKGSRGKVKPSAQALAVVELQRRLPNARVVYSSATGATQVSSLSYATRLGMWGPGTAFSNVESFIANMVDGGLAAMELVARDMKQLGVYLARSLSYEGVTYSRVEHELSVAQRQIYDRLADGWQVVLRNINEALAVTGGNENSRAKSAAMSAFWGAQQRFFNQIITGMQMPTVIAQMEQDLADGYSVVAQLVNTNEAQQNRAIGQRQSESDGESADLEELDLTPREQLLQMVEKSFPVIQYTEGLDDNGNVVSIVAKDANGNAIVNREAVQMRDKLLDDLAKLPTPQGPLEQLLDAFGPDAVAEITGRRQRVVHRRNDDGELQAVLEKRTSSSIKAEAAEFQAGKRRVLVFSDAGGTGFSFQSDRRVKNQQRRMHYLVQPGWRADKAVQGFGRTHRSNEANQPHYYLASTNIPAQKRFLSAIARRLDQLGALTKGQRDTASQGMFDERDNLESKYATEAVAQFMRDGVGNLLPVNFDDFLHQTGLEGILDENGAINNSKMPTTRLFLNRMLSLKLDMQSVVFDAFLERIDEKIEVAKQRGEFDSGMQTLRAIESKIVSDEVAYVDERSGAETRLVKLELTNATTILDFPTPHKDTQYARNKKSGRVYAVRSIGNMTIKETGAVVKRVRMDGTAGRQYRGAHELQDKKGVLLFEQVTEEEARELWAKENAERAPTFTTEVNMIVGAMLPIWDRLKVGSGKIDVARTQTVDGERLLGMVVAKRDLAEVQKRLELATAESKLPAKDVMARVLKGEDGELANGWAVQRSLVSGDMRMEVKPTRMLNMNDERALTGLGIIAETIQWRSRYFVPVGPTGVPVLEKLLAQHPLVSLSNQDQDGPAFNRQIGGRRESPLPRDAIARVIDRVAARWKGDSEAPIVVRRFTDLPAAIVAAAEAQGYNNDNPQDRIHGVAYQGRIYVVQENVTSEAQVEEVLLHERQHLALRTQGDPKSGPLHDQIQQLYRDLGGIVGIVSIAKRAGVNVRGFRAQVGGSKPAHRRVVAVDELLAYIEGQRAYENLPQRIKRVLQEFVGAARAWLRDHGFTALAAKLGVNLDQAGMTDLHNIIRTLRSVPVNDGPGGDPRFIRVWHGSPHRGIEKTGFKLNKIGTGEGAQAYGWGMYFASQREVAEGYKQRLSESDVDLYLQDRDGRRVAPDEVTDDERVLDALENVQDAFDYDATVDPDLDRVLDDLHLEIKWNDLGIVTRGMLTQEERASVDSEDVDSLATLDEIERIRSEFRYQRDENQGQLYSVEIPNDDALLDWDKPLSEQPQVVRDALKRRVTDVAPFDGLDMGGNARLRDNREGQIDSSRFDPWILESTTANGASMFGLSQADVDRMLGDRDAKDLTGQQIYTRLVAERGSQQAASEYLLSIGIPGLRYLDGGSRADGDGTRNYVIWDEALLTPEAADITPMFNRTITAGPAPTSAQGIMERARTSAMDQIHTALSHPGRVSLWDKTVGTMRNLSERVPAFKPVYEAAQRFIDDVSMLANDAADFAPRMFPRLDTWRDLAKRPVSAADSKAVAKPLFEGTLLWTRDENGKAVRAAEDAAVAGVVWTDEELRDKFGATDDQISLYRESRAAIDRSIDMTARADMMRVLGREFEGLREAVLQQETLDDASKFLRRELEQRKLAEPDAAARFDGLVSDIEQRQRAAARLMRRGYAPLSRFGRYTVDVLDAKGDRLYFGMYESRRASNLARIQMQRAFPGASVTQGTMSNEMHKLLGGITPESLELFGNMLGLESEGGEERDRVFQEYLKLTKSNQSAMRRMIHRKGIAGYSEDVGRVLASFVYANARQAAGALNAGTLDRAISEIPKEQGELRDVAMGLRNYIQDPQEEGQVIRGFLFAQYLGGSVASAFVNATQPFAITLPWLSQWGGMARASRLMSGALKDMGTRGFKYEAELARALARAEADGVVAPQEVYQLMAQARGTGSLRVGDGTRLGGAQAMAGNAWERLKVAWGQPFALAEQFNRRLTYITAYRLAQDQEMPSPDEFARRAVEETQFVYCVDSQTECLTLNGWKRRDELTPDDRLVGIDADGRAIETPLLSVHHFPGRHEVTAFSNATKFSMMLTDGHDAVVQNYDSRLKKWSKPLKRKTVDLKRGHQLMRVPAAAIERPDSVGEDFAALLGWIASEGHYAAFRGCTQRTNVRLTQSLKHNPAYVGEIEALLQRLGGHYRKFSVKAGEMVIFTLKRPLSDQVRAAMPDKILHWEMVQRMSAREMRALVQAFAKGDGHSLAEGGWSIGQKEEQNLHVLQAMAALTGGNATFYPGRDPSAGKVAHLYLHVNTKRTMVGQLTQKRTMVEDGVWCPETEAGTWIARRNGAIFVTGNSKANKARWMRGAVGGALMTFKSYSIQYLEVMQRTWNAGEPGSPERAAGRRAVAWQLAMLMLMGGAGGLPFMEDLEDLVDGIAQIMGYNTSSKQWRQQAIKKIVGEEFGEFLEDGASGIPGSPVDVSGRLGLGDLIPGTGFLMAKRDHQYDIRELSGPAGDLIARGLSAGRNIATAVAQGDARSVARSSAEVLPTAARNALFGLEMAARGMYADRRGYKVIDTTLPEAAAKFIGFQPRSVAEVQEANRFMLRTRNFYQETAAEIRAEWARALFKKDDAALQRVRGRLDKWNRDNPDQRIVIRMPDVWKRVREMSKSRSERIAGTSPKALRQQMRDMAAEVG